MIREVDTLTIYTAAALSSLYEGLKLQTTRMRGESVAG
jgi:hypothetical protein